MGFLNAELARIEGMPHLAMERAIDTVRMARQKFPGAQASLDALCKRFNIDNSARTKHGALLDAELLAEVRSEEHTSELQSLMRISYAGFCLKKKQTSDRHKPERTNTLSNVDSTLQDTQNNHTARITNSRS